MYLSWNVLLLPTGLVVIVLENLLLELLPSYAIGQGISEALFVKNTLLDAKFAKRVKLTVRTDSTAGKSMASRFGSG